MPSVIQQNVVPERCSELGVSKLLSTAGSPLLLLALLLSGCAQLNLPMPGQSTTTSGDQPTKAVDVRQTSNKHQRQALGAILGAVPAAAINRYMDNQQAALEQQLAGSGVSIQRDGDTLKLQLPAQITFASGSSEIRGELYPLLTDLAKVLAEYDKTFLVISGHTDDTGSRALNMTLSQQRANQVKEYLQLQRVDERRLLAQGLGPDQPLRPNSSAQARAENRRVEIQIEPLLTP